MWDPFWKVKETAQKTVKQLLNHFINMVAWLSKIQESTNNKMLSFLTWWRNTSPREQQIYIQEGELQIFIQTTISKLVLPQNLLKKPGLTKIWLKVTHLETKHPPPFPLHLMLNGDIFGTLGTQSMLSPTKLQWISQSGQKLWTDGVTTWLMGAIL